MSDQPDPPGLQSVLADFRERCPRPDARQLREWAGRYPAYASELAMLAAGMIAEEVLGSRRSPAASRPPLVGMVGGASAPPPSEPRTLDELLDATGVDVPELEVRTGMRREVLAKLHAGLLELPIPGRLVARIADAIGVAASVVGAAIEASHASPLTLQAKASGAPSASRQTYAAALEASGMPEGERQAWLAED